MKTVEIKIDIIKFAKYNSLAAELLRKNKTRLSKTIEYRLYMSKEQEAFFKQKNRVLRNPKSELYPNKKSLSQLEIYTMLAIAFSSKEEYQAVFNGEKVYVSNLIEEFQSYLTILEQIYHISKVKADFSIPNHSPIIGKSKLILADSKITLDILKYLKTTYRLRVLGLCEDMYTLFASSTELEVVYKINSIASEERFDDFSAKETMIGFRAFFEDLLSNKYGEVIKLIEQFNATYKSKPKKRTDRKGAYLRHIFRNLQDFLENHTEISQKKYRSIKDSEQHRLIHYISAICDIVEFEHNFIRQAQTIKDFLKNG